MVDVRETRIILRLRKLVADTATLGLQQEPDKDVSITQKFPCIMQIFKGYKNANF